LNLDAWDGYTGDFKARVIAWYRLHNTIATHVADAQADHVKREQKKQAQRARAHGHSR